ncbi:MAG: hypothetical protein HYV61_13030 [Candidatus Rokubacteria bacterium]|nr:hypothetical protein [Candidatus Rokubacteria bacterium]MBI2878870.1 hypothetical protein [Candidatus Rokubacteria bacterium]
MTHPWIVLLAMILLGVFYVLLPTVLGTLATYRAARLLRCPETGRDAEVRVDAVRAAWTSVVSRSQLEVKDCSFWPAQGGCGRACVAHGVLAGQISA